MSFPLYTMVCAGIPEEKNPGWESNKCVGQSGEIRVIGAQIGKKKRKCDRGFSTAGRREQRLKARRPARFNSRSSASGLPTKSSVRTREEISTQD